MSKEKSVFIIMLEELAAMSKVHRSMQVHLDKMARTVKTLADMYESHEARITSLESRHGR